MPVYYYGDLLSDLSFDTYSSRLCSSQKRFYVSQHDDVQYTLCTNHVCTLVYKLVKCQTHKDLYIDMAFEKHMISY